ncbi:MAG: class I SAM-dependent methyltransferase [Candidatus Micrarchaeia archaeon]|jgi:SAM-dependent methyltransferase
MPQATIRRQGGFKRGYLFPELVGDSERVRGQIEDIRKSVEGERKQASGHIIPKGTITLHNNRFREAREDKKYVAWTVINTPLKYYAYFPRKNSPPFDFEEYLLKKAGEAQKRGRKLRVLDIGIGTGKQWIDFLKKHEGKIEFSGTRLHEGIVDPGMLALAKKGKITLKPSFAANVHKKFAPGTFDLIVSCHGTHGQEQEALEGITHLLRPGGEAIVSGEKNALPTSDSASHRKFYEILGQFPPIWGGEWGYHLRKNPAKK